MFWISPVAINAWHGSALQGSGLVRTAGPCAQECMALMPQAIATARDALLNNRCESAACFERSVLCHTYQ